MSASDPVLRQLFSSNRAYRATLRPLLDASIVTYRKFSGEYRVWQGTDFDIDERSEAERDKLGHFALAALLRERDEPTPIVARRHSVSTGTLRYFPVVYADAQQPKPPAPLRGEPRIVVFLAEGRDDEGLFDTVRAVASNDIWTLYPNGAALRFAIADALALEGVQRKRFELASDPVAAREIAERLAAARLAERRALDAIVGEPWASAWHWRGERLAVPDRRALQRALSDIADCVYLQAPRIGNEMINRDRLSSQAAAARNKLLRHMLEQRDQPGLAIIGYPPERAVYRALFEAGQLHVPTETGWSFIAPGAEGADPNRLAPMWRRLDDLLAASEAKPVTARQLMDALQEPPHGVKRGVLPVLLLHYYLVRRHELAFYDDGVYAPTLAFEHLERLVRRPDLFAFQRFRIEGVRVSLVDAYGLALFGDRGASRTVLGIARPLARFVLGLDEYARKTRRLSETALRVRQAVLLSKSPERLLFDDLPAACGCAGEEQAAFTETLMAALRELKEAPAALLDYMRSALCAGFGLADGLPVAEMRVKARSRCKGLDRYTVDANGLRGFIRRVQEARAEDGDWLAGILLFLGRKPPAKWTDADRDRAEHRLADFSRRLLDLEKLRLHVDGDAGADVILLKTLTGSQGELTEVVATDQRTAAAIAEARRQVGDALSRLPDDGLALALVASVAQELMQARRQARSKAAAAAEQVDDG